MAWHAKKSASGSKRWMECSGSLVFEHSLPDNMRRPTGSAAMTGTCAHALGEFCLKHGFREVPEALKGTVIWLDAEEDATLSGVSAPGSGLLFQDGAFPGVETPGQLSAELGQDVKFFARVDDKMAEGVQLYLDVVWTDFDEMGSTAEMLVEKRFDMNWLRPDMGGTSDCTLWQFMGLLRVIDYKNGYVNVEAEDNSQGLIYALGMAQEVDWLFDDLEVVIVQPNTRVGSPVKRFKTNRAELEAFRDKLAEASDRVDEATEAYEQIEEGVDFIEWAGTYLNTGDGSPCTFCDGFAVCPAAKNRAEEIAMADFAEEPEALNPVEVHDEASLERLRQIIKWSGFLDSLVNAAKALGQRRLEQGLDMPGYKLVAGKANRKWTLPEAEIAAKIAEATGLPVESCYEEPKPPALLSPANMEKLGPGRSKARKAAKEAVATLCEKPQGKLTMAPESDPREAVEPGDAASDFVDDLPKDYGDD